MSKSSSGLSRPASAGLKRKEIPGNRSCMLRIGERLMRAGSEGNLVHRPKAAPDQPQDPPESTGFTVLELNSSFELLQRKQQDDGVLHSNPDLSSSSCGTAPRSPEKKLGILEHLRQKYPQHAAIILGQHEEPGKEVRSPPTPEGCVDALTSVEDLKLLASENMSDRDAPPTFDSFSRGTKTRASLPTQSRERTLGVLYLQYLEETKQVLMPSAVSSMDTLRALYVTAFPHQLTMKKLQSPNMAICIKDTNRNVYYNLEDVRNITPRSCLKAYHKDPVHVFNSLNRAANTDGRISKELLYSMQSPVHALQGSLSPPTVRSMPSSPCRRSCNGAAPRTRSSVSSMEPSSSRNGTSQDRAGSLNSGSSAILERRDVRPDEDRGSSSSLALIVRSDGGLQLPEPFSSSLQEVARVRLSTSSQCSAPPSLPAELRIPAGLTQYRASIKPLMGYGDGAEHHSSSLHRQHSRKYSENQQSPSRTQTPPLSPQRHGGSVGHLSLDRMSPFRRSLQRDSSGALVEIISRRRSGSSSSASSVFLDSPLSQPDGLMEGHMTTGNVQSVRMKAMEEQIASLAGLVHHALSFGPEAAGAADTVSESSGTKLSKRTGFPSESPGICAASSVTNRDRELQLRLALASRSVSELRVQLKQLRSLQILNQQSVSSMLQTASQKLLKLIGEQQAQAEQAFKPRAEMDLQRIHFLQTEETILTQLRELEDFVEGLSQPAVTLRDVEEGAVNLRRVGEALAKLKGEFPGLQVKMRSVLRPEVESVRFLKEEPHKMDSMLRRVRTLTETLSALRRSVSESSSGVRSAHVETVKVLDDNQIPSQTRSPQSSPKPQPRTRPDQNQSSHLSTNGAPAPALLFIRDSPTVVKVSPQSREGSPSLHRKPEPQQNQNRSITSQDISSHHSTKADRVSHRSVSQEDNKAKLQNQDNPTVTSVCEYDVWIPRETTAHTEPSEEEPDADRGLQASVQQKPACDDQRGGAPGVREKVEDSKAASSQLPPKDSGPPSASPTKPRRAVKQSSDGAATSSPPPPPRRLQTTSPSPTTEYMSSTRIPPVGAQDKGRNEKQLPQPKPPRQPPEVKPKPQIFARTPPTGAPSPTLQDLQVKSELSAKNHLSGEIEQKSKGRTKTSLISDVPQLQRTDERKDHLVLQLEKKKVELGLISEKTTLVEREEKPPPVPSRMNPSAQKKLTTEAGDSPTKKDYALSPMSTEKKVKVTTIVTLQKENAEEVPTSPKKTHQEAEKKSNVTVVVTLQKENTPKDPSTSSLSVLEENGSVDLGKENLATYFPSPTHSSERQREEAYVKATDSLLCSEEGGTLSQNDEGPPPPPPQMGKFKQRSKTKARSISEDESTNIDGSDLQPDEVDLSTDDGNQEPKDFEVDEDLRNKPIIVILDEPIDPQMAYKRLSTIFESEEDITGAPFKMSLERKISQEKKISSETTGEESKRVQAEQKRVSPETDSSPQVQHGKLSADPLSVPEDHKKPESPQKTEQKRKFKFKFPKNKLASLSQVIRTNKAEKKTLELVVYEEEEETQPDRNTKNRTKAPSSLEITSSKAEDVKVSLSKSHTRVEQLRRNTFDTINSLEESIKQLEISVDSISSPLPGSPPSPLDSTHRGQVKSRASRERERSPSKRHAPNPPKGPNPPQSKKAKPQPGRDTARTTARRQTSNSSSSALRSHTKTHHSSSSSPPEKTSRTHRQDTQTQSSESTITSGADATVPSSAQRVSKIPALCPTAAQKPLRSSASSYRKPVSSPPVTDDLTNPIPPSHKSFIPSLSLRRLLPSSYRLTSPSLNDGSAHHSGKDQPTTSSCSTPSSSSATFMPNSPSLRRK